MQIAIGKGIKLDVDFDRFTGPVLEHVLMIGARNILMDCHAGITKADKPDTYEAESRAKATTKLEAMYAGDIRVARASSGVTRDPVRAEALKMARRAINAVFAETRDGWKIRGTSAWLDVKTSEFAADYDLTGPDGYAALHAALVDMQADAMMDAAERIVEERATAPKVSLAGLVKKA